MIDDLKKATILTALNHMVKQGSFSICTIDKCAEILGVQVRGSESYNILSALHCINYAEMPPEVRRAIPQLIKDCLNVETLFDAAIFYDQKQEPVERERKGFLSRLLQ